MITTLGIFKTFFWYFKFVVLVVFAVALVSPVLAALSGVVLCAMGFQYSQEEVEQRLVGDFCQCGLHYDQHGGENHNFISTYRR